MKTLYLIMVSCLILSSNTLTAKSDRELLQSEVTSINAIWEKLNNVELCFTSKRTTSADEEVTTRTEKYIFFRPYFSCEVVISKNGKPVHKYKYTFDGERYYLLIEDNRLEISSSISNIYITGMATSPLTRPWFPLLYIDRCESDCARQQRIWWSQVERRIERA